MKDYLLDLVEHTYDLGCIDMIKITGSDTETLIDGIGPGMSVIVQGQFNKPSPEFVGSFGMPNLNKLKILLGLEPYRKNANITVNSSDINGEQVLTGLHFENEDGDFNNDYRFMVKNIVEDLIKRAKFTGASWNIEFEPTVASVQRLKMMASANSDEPNFQVKTQGDKVKVFFGDHSTHAGEFVFHSGVIGSLAGNWYWPTDVMIKILDLPGDKTVSISDAGMARITVNSGIASYTYYVPGKTK